jgi:hypothetical protein
MRGSLFDGKPGWGGAGKGKRKDKKENENGKAKHGALEILSPCGQQK